jgi:hypothetical protein
MPWAVADSSNDLLMLPLASQRNRQGHSSLLLRRVITRITRFWRKGEAVILFFITHHGPCHFQELKMAQAGISKFFKELLRIHVWHGVKVKIDQFAKCALLF